MAIEDQVNAMDGEEQAIPVQEQQEHEVQNTGGGWSFDFGWLRTPTGDGEIGDRLDHPLNPQKSHGVAQILRGVEGFAGTLRLAVLDIALGAAELMKERRGNGGSAL